MLVNDKYFFPFQNTQNKLIDKKVFIINYSLFTQTKQYLFRKCCFILQCIGLFAILLLFTFCTHDDRMTRIRINFGNDWKFHVGDTEGAFDPVFNDSDWRLLNLPHDWSIEGKFSEDHPATPGGGALPGGIGWYRKTFVLAEQNYEKSVFIDFDGIYQNSEVWINGHYLGKRPYGYISFRYELTPYLNRGMDKNVLAVKVDNSMQPNSRWYSGSGIYRNVWLIMTDKIFVDHWGTFITTPQVSDTSAIVKIKTTVRNVSQDAHQIRLTTEIVDSKGKKVASNVSEAEIMNDSAKEFIQKMEISYPKLWSVEHPYLYKALTSIEYDGSVSDHYETGFGIRFFSFDSQKGFFLNGKPMKIFGVCNHHDLGCLGAAINTRALERQLEILKEMGCNSIRTSHNPPAPELLDLCDKMGFLVMDETFDMWKMEKVPYDYHLYWDEWHVRDLEDFILRDRNHPSVFIWSIGNEIREQWDTTGSQLAIKLVHIVKGLDPTRPVTSGMNYPEPGNYIIKSGSLDLIGFNYHHQYFVDFPKNFPGQKFIASETNSGIATRGYYDMPSDSIRIWPSRWDQKVKGNPDFTCSSYDNCRVPWGSTHEDTWRIISKYDYLSGIYIWTGFDYLGEPTPYWWPARSSYFGLVDLAGFPKDSYYFYKSAWTEEPVLHIFPHWNWEEGDIVDVWAYTNCDEVELFLNGQSLGTKHKNDDTLHLMWRIPYEPGEIKGVGKKGDKEILTSLIKTAAEPAKIILEADRNLIRADGRDLSFIKVTITDRNGIVVPDANNLVQFNIEGAGFITGVDNGDQTSHEPFRANSRKAFNGLCLAVIQSFENPGKIILTAVSEGLEQASVEIEAKPMELK